CGGITSKARNSCLASSSSAAFGIRFISTGKLFPATRVDAGRDGRREPGWRVARAPAAVMFSLGGAPELNARRIPITPMPTAARTTSAVVSLALDIRIKRRAKRLKAAPTPVTPDEAMNLAELRLATRWL